ncbi:amidohydrolase family protein [Clostridioides sp. ES-S-0108-01]|uniref:amidohydrolase family protein n=1 Tax=unclassified Clostridioides TaxID=2635829 RepID=UPI001D0C6CCD|nr:amidohydrolase family protein [Clostridioides sp. ES-S-0171-01]MCC0688465.1 amidohydrolase family protein [Clostridioides sp. ES-S-0056-01]MCC0715973.1 amidohydrolase family protein [Clostridioides sp. ES-S-0077-01]MCC0784019.1 amidohydrolase family protein [Clostridioides sp. ES-S-0108-01]UDN51147.1 amidohydrolase family protein [Clostridioides sp. ES-S-0107-01]UDN54642.1 amidohydrolase family protein [Clostridioides sp. ES-S-0054-01]
MKNLLIRNGTIISPTEDIKFEKRDILVLHGKIYDIGLNLKEKIRKERLLTNKEFEIINADNMYIAPGFIDVHTHCYKRKLPTGMDSDSIGIEKGSTVIFDAGTAGPLNYYDFKKKYMDKCKTEVYSFLNVTNEGLNILNESTSLDVINFNNVESVVEKNMEKIKGIKVKASKFQSNENGVDIIKKSKEVAKKLNLPLVVYIGEYPSYIDEVMNILGKGDVVTPVYGNSTHGIFNEFGILRKSVINAKNRGVLFDVCHGLDQFDFEIFKKAVKQGLEPDLISTDMHIKNMKDISYSLLNVINKIMELGIPFEKCIEKVTEYPTKIFNLHGSKGRIKVGGEGDFTIFTMKDSNDIIKDYNDNELTLKKKLSLQYTVKSWMKSSEVYRHEYEGSIIN